MVCMHTSLCLDCQNGVHETIGEHCCVCPCHDHKHVAYRSQIKVDPVAKSSAFRYVFSIALEDGSCRTLSGYAADRTAALDAAHDRWFKIEDKGYYEGA